MLPAFLFPGAARHAAPPHTRRGAASSVVFLCVTRRLARFVIHCNPWFFCPVYQAEVHAMTSFVAHGRGFTIDATDDADAMLTQAVEVSILDFGLSLPVLASPQLPREARAQTRGSGGSCTGWPPTGGTAGQVSESGGGRTGEMDGCDGAAGVRMGATSPASPPPPPPPPRLMRSPQHTHRRC